MMTGRGKPFGSTTGEAPNKTHYSRGPGPRDKKEGMMDKCPFCRVKREPSYNVRVIYECKTYKTFGGYKRGEQCYRTELATLREQLLTSERTSMFHSEYADDLYERLNSTEELLRKAGKIFIFAVRGRPCSPFCPCSLCQIGRLAQAFLAHPEVVRVMEEGSCRKQLE